jgi:hypothetical protein
MHGGNALIAKGAPNLIDPVKAADHQPLEMEFQGNPQIEILVKGMVMSDKGARQRSAGMRLKDRSLYLHKPSVIKKIPYGSDGLAAQSKNASALFVGDEVKISLAIAFFHVSQPVPLLWQRTKGFAEHNKIGYLQSEFSGLCAEESPSGPDDVANINILKKLVSLLAQEVVAKRKLYLPRAIPNIQKGHLADGTPGHDAASERYLLRLLSLQFE